MRFRKCADLRHAHRPIRAASGENEYAKKHHRNAAEKNTHTSAQKIQRAQNEQDVATTTSTLLAQPIHLFGVAQPGDGARNKIETNIIKQKQTRTESEMAA